MKTPVFPNLVLFAAALVWCVPDAEAQRQLGQKKGATGKVFLAEVKGDAQIRTRDRVHTARQATAFDAPGTIFETEPDSHLAFVLSNGTGIYLDANTRMEIEKLDQSGFNTRGTSTENEPSISTTSIMLAQGFMGASTSQMSSGSTMVFNTPHGSVNVRGRNVALQAHDDYTVVYLMEGDVTVRTKGLNFISQVMRPGEQATIYPGPPPSIVITPIPEAKKQDLLRVLQIASASRKTVTFETIASKSLTSTGGGDATGTTGGPATGSDQGPAAGFDQDGEPEIVARPSVPVQVPHNITVSPATLPARGGE